MLGLGLRREMLDWDLLSLQARFFEVVPENWVHRDRSPLHALIEGGRPVHLHGVSMNLGGTSPISPQFLRELRGLIDDLSGPHGVPHYSDHLAASGDAHQLYDLFPIPFTPAEVARVAGRIQQVQDGLGLRMAVENSTWYSNTGTLAEADFLAAVAERADCDILLDLNNISVNRKNHGTHDLAEFTGRIDLARVRYMHVAGHEYDARFELYIDTHSQGVEPDTAAMARQLQAQHGLPILLEWDNDLPDLATINRELACLMPFTTT